MIHVVFGIVVILYQQLLSNNFYAISKLLMCMCVCVLHVHCYVYIFQAFRVLMCMCVCVLHVHCYVYIFQAFTTQSTTHTPEQKYAHINEYHLIQKGFTHSNSLPLQGCKVHRERADSNDTG